MLDFRPVSIDDKTEYERRLHDSRERGCESDFCNIFLWGEQNIAYIEGQIVMLGKFGERYYYYFPLGKGDKKQAIDAIIEDAKKRNIPCRINSIYEPEKAFLESNYPNCFAFEQDRGSFDYVYSIDDLADLSGKKYHGKRNHISQFRKEHPDYRVSPITKSDIPKVAELFEIWYQRRIELDPEGEYSLERRALLKALDNHPELGMESLMITDNDKVLAFTFGSRMSDSTFDVHFEKAHPDAPGAYTVVNHEFARYIRQKYPKVLFLDREEDMGIMGLRKAKESYYPHHLIEKFRAEYVGD